MSLILFLCLAGVVAFLIKKAPFIDEPYKGFALWVLMALVALYVIYFFIGPVDFWLPRRR